MADHDTEELVAKAKAEYDFLRLTFVDIHGIYRCKIYPNSSFDSVLREGFGIFSGMLGICMDGALDCLPTEMKTTFPNDMCKPIPSTLHPLPLHGSKDARVGEVFCVIQKYGEPTSRAENPWNILQNQLDKLEKVGYLLKSAWELEYMVVDPETLSAKFDNMNYIYAASPLDFANSIYYQAYNVLSDMGVRIGPFSSEAGRGQYEISFAPEIGMKQASNLLQLKEVLKKIHRANGDLVITMTKPYSGTMSNGIHLNHSLLDASTKRNVFYDCSSSLRLSDTWRYWMGGILKHSPAITAFACPTVNCYRRLHQLGTPSKADWGIDDRMASFRVKNISESESYIEARMPSGSHNPYLSMAAFVAAGLDGLNNKYDIPEQRGQEKSEPTTLPRTLEEALSALEQDQYMVSAMGEDFVKWFVQIKRAEIQCKAVRDFDPNVDDPAAYELERTLYMDFV